MPNVTMSGTWDLKDIADILRKHKEGSLKIEDAIWEILKKAKQ